MEDEIKPCTEKHFKFQVGVGFGFVLANWQLLISKIQLTVSLSKCKLDKIINLMVFHGHFFDISFLKFQKQLILSSNFDKG